MMPSEIIGRDSFLGEKTTASFALILISGQKERKEDGQNFYGAGGWFVAVSRYLHVRGYRRGRVACPLLERSCRKGSSSSISGTFRSVGLLIKSEGAEM